MKFETAKVDDCIAFIEAKGGPPCRFLLLLMAFLGSYLLLLFAACCPSCMLLHCEQASALP